MFATIPTRPLENLDLPDPLRRLADLAFNFWWSWHREARQIFQRVDEGLWSRYRNPVRLLQLVPRARLRALAEDEGFLAEMGAVLQRFDAHTALPRPAGDPLAYVSAEYALSESLPIYSGGLGVLSADHLKEASDLGLPMVAVGLFYRRGYFHQIVDADGAQQHNYPDLDGQRLPVLRVAAGDDETLRVPVEMPGRTLLLRVWVTFVGRVPLLLLDSYSTHNHLSDRYTTSLLYVRSRELRLEQEIVLGRGAVAVLEALGIRPRLWHMNEGHSAFLALENLRRCGEVDLDRAIANCRPRHVFTTHTPVPEGNEVFDVGLVRPYLESTARDLNTNVDALLDLGRPDGQSTGFNLTRLALELSQRANAVSNLHAEVSRKMWPDYEIRAVTNGIHVASWLGREMAMVLTADPADEPEALAQRAKSLTDEALWAAHTAQKHRLMRFVRMRAVRQAARHGAHPRELRRIEELLNPSALTLGFARRFAPYKRADLLFDDHERLKALLCSQGRPVQLIMAGKAHPADRQGQQIIQNVWRLAGTPELRGRIVFVEDYDLAVARLMVRGVDVWLNTPEWPREASGTSGMKAAANGVLHTSVPDGWWAEACSDETGFTLGGQEHPDRPRDGRLLYELLEQRIVPLYYERGADGLPRRWIALMRAAMVAYLGRFSTRRMLRDYERLIYGLPALAETAAT